MSPQVLLCTAQWLHMYLLEANTQQTVAASHTVIPMITMCYNPALSKNATSITIAPGGLTV
jgi:hypothetical protein